MYYPEGMTQDDIEAFELDMAALTIREEYETANWELDVAADDLRQEEIGVEWQAMMTERYTATELESTGWIGE